MKKTFKLSNPIMIDGNLVKEISYDLNEITALQFSEASARAAALTKKNQSITMKFRENDYALHMYLGFMAILAINPSYAVEDLERLKGEDVLLITDIGLLFIMRTSGETSQQSSLDVQSENTADTSTQALETLQGVS